MYFKSTLWQCLKLNLIAKAEKNVAFVHELVFKVLALYIYKMCELKKEQKVSPDFYINIWTISQQGYSIHAESAVPSSHYISLEVELNWRISHHLSFAGRHKNRIYICTCKSKDSQAFNFT